MPITGGSIRAITEIDPSQQSRFSQKRSKQSPRQLDNLNENDFVIRFWTAVTGSPEALRHIVPRPNLDGNRGANLAHLLPP